MRAENWMQFLLIVGFLSFRLSDEEGEADGWI